MLYFVPFLVCLSTVTAQFPMPCCNDEAVRTKVCCPADKSGSRCGESSGKGRCVPYVVKTRAQGKIPLVNDDRLEWPTFYFNTTCQCNGNFDGYDCTDCKPGYRGDTCNTLIKVVRKEFTSMSLLEQTRFKSDLHYCKSKMSDRYCIIISGDRFRKDAYEFRNASVYDVSCFGHYYSTRTLIRNNEFTSGGNFAHGNLGFLTWHRWYLLNLERELQRCTNNPNFALHYHNWIGETTCTVCTNDMFGDNDKHGQIDKTNIFSTWRGVCASYDMAEQACIMGDCECERPRIIRKPGFGMIKQFPTYDSIQQCLQMTTYSDFASCFESVHNYPHVYFGGTMENVPIACNDPWFFLHHVFIDCIFEDWVRFYKATPSNYTSTTVEGHRATDCIVPGIPCKMQRSYLQNSNNLGYTCDIFNDS